MVQSLELRPTRPVRHAPRPGARDAEAAERVVTKLQAAADSAAQVVPRLRAQPAHRGGSRQPRVPRDRRVDSVRAPAPEIRRVPGVPRLTDLLVQGLEHVANLPGVGSAALLLHARRRGPLRAILRVDEQRQELLLDVLNGTDPVNQVRHLQAADLELLSHVQVKRGAAGVAPHAKRDFVVPSAPADLLLLLLGRLAADLLEVILSALVEVGVGERPRAVLNLAEALRFATG